MMKTTVIVPTYNRPQELRLCLLTLTQQSKLPSEVLIADDGSGPETQKVIEQMRESLRALFPIKHVWQEDKGFRKPKILNETVRQSSGDYLIFIDGDCMAHRDFVKAHVENSHPDRILSGKRVEVGEKLTEHLLKEGTVLNSLTIRLLWDAVKGKSRKVEEAVPIRNRFLRLLLHRDRITPDGVWGCNFSLYKDLFIAINGCDEDFVDGSIEDNDIGIRVLNQGKELKTVRGLAIIFHLWHKSTWNFENEKYRHNLAILQWRISNKEKVCQNGIRKLKEPEESNGKVSINVIPLRSDGMKTSVIVSTYNNPRALRLCMLSLTKQSKLPGEVLVADDGSAPETRETISKLKETFKDVFSIQHVWHEDRGFRKPKILNDAVRQSSGDYLIFIDGDCMAHRDFVRSHIEYSSPSAILGGKRVEIGGTLAKRLLKEGKVINSLSIRLMLDAITGNSRKVEEALQIRSTYLRRSLHRDRITDDGIWGCNCSLSKDLYLEINGFDEDFQYSVEDNDLGIRVLNLGKQVKSVRGLAIVFHLWHPVRWNFNNEKYQHDLAILKRRLRSKEALCKNGIKKL